MAVLGLRGTGDWGTDERPKNFREMILWRDPNGDAPLTALMSKMRKETTNDPEFAWWEEELNALRIQINAAATTGDATLTVDTGSYDARNLVKGDVLMVEKTEDTGYTFEFVEVVSNPTASNTFTVSRGAADTTADTIASGDYLTKIGTAFGEGTSSPKSTNRNPTKYKNYTQIFKTAYELTGTAIETKLRTGDPMSNDKKRRSFDHSSAMEFAWLFGKPYETTDTNGKPKRYTGGLMHWLAEAYSAGSTHCIKIFTTTPTEDELLDAISPVWDYRGGGAGNERLGLAGNGFLNEVNKLIKNSSSTQINFGETVKVFGMNLRRVTFPQGSILIRTHPLMNTHGRFKYGCFLVNPSGLRYRPMKGRDTVPQDNIQNNDEDTKKGQWRTEAGVEFNHLKTMAYIRIPAG